MVKNLFLTILLILVALAIFAIVGVPKISISSGGGSSAAPTAPAPSTPATASSASAHAAAPASAPNRIAPGGKAVVARESQMILQYGTWRIPAGTEVLILEITGQNAKVRANGQEGTVVLSALQP